jgi:hypothetical protein
MGVPASDDFFVDDVIDEAINEALATVEEEHYWPWSEQSAIVTVAGGTNFIQLPPDWRATRGLWYQGSELLLVSSSDLMGYGATAGAPQVYADVGRQIQVAPTPASDVLLTHIYHLVPATLTADDQVPLLPGSMSGAVVAKAAELLSAREDDQSARQAHGNDYIKWIQRMLRSQRRTTGPLKVRVRPGGWI